MDMRRPLAAHARLGEDHRKDVDKKITRRVHEIRGERSEQVNYLPKPCCPRERNARRRALTPFATRRFKRSDVFEKSPQGCFAEIGGNDKDLPIGTRQSESLGNLTKDDNAP